MAFPTLIVGIDDTGSSKVPARHGSDPGVVRRLIFAAEVWRNKLQASLVLGGRCIVHHDKHVEEPAEMGGRHAGAYRKNPLDLRLRGHGSH